MAVKPLASITTVADILAYAEAEYKDAVKKCPKAAAMYASAVSQAKTYATAAAPDASYTASYVNAVKQQIYQAREYWYTVGCASPSGTITIASAGSAGAAAKAAEKEHDASVVTASFFGIDWKIWMLGSALLVAGLWLAKKGKLSRRTVTTRRRTSRSKRRAPRRRRR